MGGLPKDEESAQTLADSLGWTKPDPVVLPRHLRDHAIFGDTPDGSCGCADCEPRDDCACRSCRNTRIDANVRKVEELLAKSKMEVVEEVVELRARLDDLTSEPALAAFREAWEQADAEGAKGDRVRRGMAAAIEAVS